jgi:hypothetical protein
MTPLGNDGELGIPGGLPNHSTRINAILERQHENGVAYSKESRRRSLDS